MNQILVMHEKQLMIQKPTNERENMRGIPKISRMNNIKQSFTDLSIARGSI